MLVRLHNRFLRGDQYAIALALLDEGKVVLGILACPNLPLASIGGDSRHSSHDEVGCLFFAKVGAGTYMQSLDGSSPIKVCTYRRKLYQCIPYLYWYLAHKISCLSIALQVHVSTTENPEEASFFESFEAAHSMHDLSSSIAKVLCSLLSYINYFITVILLNFLP